MAKTEGEVRAGVAMGRIVLGVLVARAGGSITVSVDEFKEVVERSAARAT